MYYKTVCSQKEKVMEQVVFDVKQTQLIKAFLHCHAVSMAAFITALWSVLLADYADQSSLPALYAVKPEPVGGEGGSPQILPLRVEIQTDDNFITLLHKAEASIKELERSSGGLSEQKPEAFEASEYFNISITELPGEKFRPDKAGAATSEHSFTNQSQPEINILHSVNQRTAAGVLQYNRVMFAKGFIKRLFAHYNVLAEKCLKEPFVPVFSHSLLTKAEYRKIVIDWNKTEKPYDRDKTIYRLFEEQVLKTPDADAVEYREQKLSYNELNCRSNQVGDCVRESYSKIMRCGLAPDTLVGVFMDRGLELMPSILGILKAGGAYVPIDSQYPDERIKFIIKDSRIKILLTQTKLYNKITGIAAGTGLKAVICVDEELKAGRRSCGNLEPVSGRRDLAYAIYTSGSTGMPKGVLIEHEGVTNLVHYVVKRLEITPGSRVMQFASVSFDASVYEWAGTLTVGGTLVVLSEEELPPQADVSDIILQKNINIAMLTPSVIRVMKKRKLPALKTLAAHGEVCTLDIVRYWGKGRLFINVYGPTEITVACTMGQCLPGKAVTIGTPLYNKKLYVLNQYLNPVPVGIPGELWVGGDGLARSYLYRKELTSERFIHKEITDSEGQRYTVRLYKTGDLVRWRPDGSLEYIGRNDCQVKLRGFRIELGEIEHNIRQFPGITGCVVQLYENGNNRRLAAYYTAGRTIELEDLKKHLLLSLPGFMVPAFFICMESIPLNSNGKTDRKALPDPGATLCKQESLALPQDEIGKKLKKIWCEILKQQNIGINDNFFSIGGDSILIIQMASRARESGIYLTPKQIAENPTIAGLAAAALHQGQAKGLGTLDLAGEFELTPIQKWFFQQQFEEPQYFNQSQIVQAEHCDRKRLARAVKQLVQCHPELRIKIVSRNHEKYQSYVTAPVSVTVHKYILTDMEEPGREMAGICEKWHRKLDYEAGRLMNVGLITGHPDGKDRIFITIHHIAVDGISWRILLKDLKDFYHGRDVVPQEGCFKEWSAALAGYARADSTIKQLEYWRAVQMQSGRFQLPVDFNTEDNRGACYRELVLTVGESETGRLMKDCAKAYHTQVNDLLVAAWVLSLSEWTQNQTVAFKLEGHGREHCVSDIDISRTTGWFTALFPVCIHIGDERSLGAVIKSIKEYLRGIPDHGLSYGVLRYCHPEPEVRDMLTLPEPQAAFNYLGRFDSPEAGQDDWVTFSNDSAQDNSSPHNHGPNLFELNCSVVFGQLNLFIKYSSLHFKEAAIKKFSDLFTCNLSSIIKHCSQQKREEFTPGDFPLVRIGQTRLEEIVRAYHYKYCLEKMYPLTPLQEGLLFHYTQNRESDQYFVQMVWEHHGRLDFESYCKAWKLVMEENEVLRTFFLWEGLEAPCQCVVSKAEVPCSLIDLSALPGVIQKDKIDEILKNDRRTPFVLSTPSAFRLTLIVRSEDMCTVIFSYHHIILDGWSMPVLINRVHRLYAGMEVNRAGYKPEIQFEAYIKWLLSKDKGEALNFWRAEVAETEKPTKLPAALIGTIPDIRKPIENHRVESLELEEASSEKIRQFARERGISLNTLLQFAWGKLLRDYSNDAVTVFGMVVSGRAVDLPNVDSQTGMFINTVPLVMRWDGGGLIEENLIELHRRIQEMNFHGYIGLHEIKALSLIKDQPMFYSIVAFENYISDYQHDFGETKISQIREHEKTNYPITVTVCNQNGSISVRVLYDADFFSACTIRQILEHLLKIIHFSVENPASDINELRLVPGEAYKQANMPEFKTASGEEGKPLPVPENTIHTLKEFTAPKNKLEEKLVEVWRQVLGLESISTLDTFYFLGGHSLNVLPIVNLLKKAGITITVNQIFQHQTIAEIAAYIQKCEAAEYQDRVDGCGRRIEIQTFPKGGFPLSAVQSRFLKRKLTDVNRFNSSCIVLLKKNLSIDTIKSALEKMLERYDALGLVFSKTGEGVWYQYYRPVLVEEIFIHVDLGDETGGHDAFISDYCSRLQFQFDIETGPLFKIIIFEHYRHEDRQVMFLIFHHLIFDGVSLKIFLEDFKELSRFSEVTDITPPENTASYSVWCLSLAEYAAGNDFEAEAEYWRSVLKGGRSLEVDTPSESWPTHRDMVTVVKDILKGSDQVSLLKEAAAEAGMSNMGLLLTALAGACLEVKEQPDLLLHIMSYQRESFFRQVPIHRTIGFFAGAYPIRIKLGKSRSGAFDPVLEAEAIRETLYQVPKEGLDYLVLKYLLPDIRKDLQLPDDPSHMLFHYMSQETDFSGDEFYQLLPVSTGRTDAPENLSNYLLNITAVQKKDSLSLTCYYSPFSYKADTVDGIIEAFSRNLKLLIKNYKKESTE